MKYIKVKDLKNRNIWLTFHVAFAEMKPVTICLARNDKGRVMGYTVSVCNKLDKHNELSGKGLAFKRMLDMLYGPKSITIKGGVIINAPKKYLELRKKAGAKFLTYITKK